LLTATPLRVPPSFSDGAHGGYPWAETFFNVGAFMKEKALVMNEYSNISIRAIPRNVRIT